MIKLGIISFAHGHANSYAKAVQQSKGTMLLGIADADRVRGEEAAARFGVQYYADYQQLLEQDIDAVIITSENLHHKEHVIAAAKAGKHILCEKPISPSTSDAEEMIRICREHGVILQTAFPCRFATPVIQAKQWIDEGNLGRIVAIKGTNRGKNPGGWFNNKQLAGGGAVIDHTVHVVDLMRWFMKAEVKQVYAEIGQLHPHIEVEDCGLLNMQFDNGVFATLDCSWSRNATYPTWGDVTMEIVGTEGTLTLDAFHQKSDLYSNRDGHKYSYWGDDMDLGLLRDFIHTIASGKPIPSITGEDGLRAVEVALAAYESSEKGKPVSLHSKSI